MRHIRNDVFVYMNLSEVSECESRASRERHRARPTRLFLLRRLFIHATSLCTASLAWVARQRVRFASAAVFPRPSVSLPHPCIAEPLPKRTRECQRGFEPTFFAKHALHEARRPSTALRRARRPSAALHGACRPSTVLHKARCPSAAPHSFWLSAPGPIPHTPWTEASAFS